MTNHQTRPRARRGILAGALALAGLAVTAQVAGATAVGPLQPVCAATATACAFDIYAGPSTIALPGVAAQVPTYAFGLGALPSPTLAGVGGPTLVVAQGQTITINVHNGLVGAELALAIPQALSSWTHTVAGITGLKHNGSDTTGVALGATNYATYTITNAQPGTYLYSAGASKNGKREVAMGLFGALIVEPTTPAVTFADEKVVVLSELDLNLNTAENPLAFEMNDPNGWNPTWYLVNGRPEAADVAVTPGANTLVHYVNAGIGNHWMGSLGMLQHHLAFDAHPIQNVSAPFTAQGLDAVVEALPGGSTADDLIAIPAITVAPAGTRFMLSDQGKDAGLGGLGMALFLQVDGAANPPAACNPTVQALVAPLGTTVAATGSFTASGTVSQCTTPPVTADRVYYATDTPPTPQSTFAAVSGGAFGPVGAGSLVLLSGQHRLFLQAAVGTTLVGAVNSIAFTVDRVGPDVTRAYLASAVTNGATALHYYATGDETFTGGSNVAAFTATIVSDATKGAVAGCLAQTVFLVPAVQDVRVDIQGDLDVSTCTPALAEGVRYGVMITAADTFGVGGTPALPTLTGTNSTSVSDNQLFVTPPATPLNDIGYATFIVDGTGPTVTGGVIQQRLPGTEAQPQGTGTYTPSNNGSLGFDLNQHLVRVYATGDDTLTGGSNIQDTLGAWQDTTATATAAPDALCNPAALIPPRTDPRGVRLDPAHRVPAGSMVEKEYTLIPLDDLNRFTSLTNGAIGSPSATGFTDAGKSGKWIANQFGTSGNKVMILSSPNGTSDGVWGNITGTTTTGGLTVDRWHPATGAGTAPAPAAGSRYGLSWTVSFWVRAQDAAGNWGPCASIPETIDSTLPIAPVFAAPGVTQEGGAIRFLKAGKALGKASRFTLHLHGTDALGADAADGGTLSAAEWFDGKDPGFGKGHTLRMTPVKGNAFVVNLDATVDVSRWASGLHTVTVRVRDMAGNWSVRKSLKVAITFRPLFASGFENGMKGWKATGHVKITKGAALSGKKGLAVRNGAVLHTDRAVSAYHASFRIDTNGSTTGGDTQVLLSGNQGRSSVFTLERRTDATGQYLRIRAHDGTSTRASAWMLVTDDVHTVAVDWYASHTGELDVSIDGVALTSLTGLETSALRIDRIGLGATGTSKAAGTLYVDQYASTH